MRVHLGAKGALPEGMCQVQAPGGGMGACTSRTAGKGGRGMLEGLDKDQRLQIVMTLHRIEGLIDKLPEAIAAAVVEYISEDAAEDAVEKALNEATPGEEGGG